MKINNTYKGMICIILSAFCFAVMNACVKLSGDLPTFQKAFFRNIVALIAATIMLARTEEKFQVCWCFFQLRYHHVFHNTLVTGLAVTVISSDISI